MSRKDTLLIVNGTIVNEGRITEADIFVRGGRVEAIGRQLDRQAGRVIDASGLHVLPGLIDDQVHFREPGLTHKAEIMTEARAAVAGGVTSFMEMPNVKPQTLTQDLLQAKYDRAAAVSLANYSFYMGVSNDNLEEALKTDGETVCGLKVFMGSSTGNMLVDDEAVLEGVFSRSPLLIATHCEKEPIVRANEAAYREKFGDEVPFSAHPEIRSIEACYRSSSFAVNLAKKHGTRLHVLHISTAEELELFDRSIHRSEKKVTAEACVHHLWFDAGQYETHGSKIKCNPAIKDARHKPEVLKAVLDGRIDVIATDHAPHTQEEKAGNYWSAPSGLPLVQHSLLMLLDFYKRGKISLEQIADKAAHAVADIYRVRERGYIREGYWADLAIVDLNAPHAVTSDSLHYKCGWSPLEGHEFGASVTHTVVSGHLAYERGQFDESRKGDRLLFNR